MLLDGKGERRQVTGSCVIIKVPDSGALRDFQMQEHTAGFGAATHLFKVTGGVRVGYFRTPLIQKRQENAKTVHGGSVVPSNIHTVWRGIVPPLLGGELPSLVGTRVLFLVYCFESLLLELELILFHANSLNLVNAGSFIVKLCHKFNVTCFDWKGQSDQQG
jgi:hypothetical protein